jgi:predicted dehydrogenase
MTERYEITNVLQRALVGDAGTFGVMTAGTPEEPAVSMESVHYLLKRVAGAPLRRPAWFFDVAQQGEGLSDVGTHLVDLVAWILFPDQGIDYRADVRILTGKRWPTVLTVDDFQKVTGESAFADCLRGHVHDGRLHYYCNNAVTYLLRGIHVRLDVLWDLEAAPGAADSHLATFRGSKSRVEVRQGKEENYRPELFVVPNTSAQAEEIGTALCRKVNGLQDRYPGVGVEQAGGRWRVCIPERYRVGHEAHFAEVTRQFLRYLEDPKSLPTWEKLNMLAKYYVTTQGVETGKE